TGDVLGLVGIDQEGVAQLVRGAGELREHEDAVAVGVACDVLLGDQVHAVEGDEHASHTRHRLAADATPAAASANAAQSRYEVRNARATVLSTAPIRRSRVAASAGSERAPCASNGSARFGSCPDRAR